MTDTPAPAPHASFWQDRADNRAAIADAAKFVLEAIEDGRAGGLYNDGLPHAIGLCEQQAASIIGLMTAPAPGEPLPAPVA